MAYLGLLINLQKYVCMFCIGVVCGVHVFMYMCMLVYVYMYLVNSEINFFLYI